MKGRPNLKAITMGDGNFLQARKANPSDQEPGEMEFFTHFAFFKRIHNDQLSLSVPSLSLCALLSSRSRITFEEQLGIHSAVGDILHFLSSLSPFGLSLSQLLELKIPENPRIICQIRVS